MKILILEDESEKFKVISKEILDFNADIKIDHSLDRTNFIKKLEREVYDLIIIDLIVPTHPNSEPKDLSESIIYDLRDEECPNAKTPVLALTQFDAVAIDNFAELNSNNINVITFSIEKEEWKKTLNQRLLDNSPAPKYDFIIICALPKEANAYKELNLDYKESKSIQGLDCLEISIDNHVGVIITCPRMGLVDAAITSAMGLQIFKPKLVAMSGICAGIKDKAQIYDITIPELCYQHDSGKWTMDGFTPEQYSIQLDHAVKLKIKDLITKTDFVNSILNGIQAKRSEIPDDFEQINTRIQLGTLSSGSAVIADEDFNSTITKQHRRVAAFEMETYAVYESARLADFKPIFFSAKAVVDNGTPAKNDDFHRIACLISAKTTIEIIKVLLA
ncbi:hypothetical protein ACX0AN_002170 [Acinetobacter baumannii]|uniref:5'-methylthioadenosine/S-adenosylhomocysteine nucleosidase family protein n=4 Tax=Acinetobacter baumannii TaxID=470 RepID=UPI0002B93467|nr:hypothetical protein [Acinetobacter baumannii]EHU3239236.1 hypothetical protein [Acinetobacter baumannii]EJB8459996.1 hypothetical protein [Acinetobacter baumannii]EJB8477745.1 hypothetical protein [Acinetobacter baumannii]EJB8552665.1 hypothetical protein [Acinetobacter baumannii]EJB8567306.1 hypothetical protein [Acinetobacter baumannii]